MTVVWKTLKPKFHDVTGYKTSFDQLLYETTVVFLHEHFILLLIGQKFYFVKYLLLVHRALFVLCNR